MRGSTLAAALLLAACGRGEDAVQRGAAEKLGTFDVAEPAAPRAAGPQIAYTYTLAYSLAPGAIAAAQARHVALCRALGAGGCIVLATDLTRGDDSASASTRLLVDARAAAAFGRRLDAQGTAAGGDLVSRNVAAEDVSRQIVDTGAKVRAKQALAERLLGLIRGARGSVADLVAAEKAYADVQEELDAARTLDAELRRRVALSAIEISYASNAGTGAFGPVGEALGTAGESFLSSLGVAITFVVAAVPWLLVGAPVFLLLRLLWRRRPRRPWRRGPTGPPA